MKSIFAAVVMVLVVAPDRADDPPKNVKARLEQVKLTPAQAKIERSEKIGALNAKVDKFVKRHAEARKVGDKAEADRLAKVLELILKRRNELANERVPK